MLQVDRQQTVLLYTITEKPALICLPYAAIAGSTSIRLVDF